MVIMTSSVRHKAPSLLLWTADYFDVAGGAAAGSTPPTAAMLVAGMRGETLLMLGLSGEVP